ncbi:MAG: hypothetical protein V3V02_09815 [Rhizobiaceae bacterium]
MSTTSETTSSNLTRETNIIGDDIYLVEMTERLKRLRSLMGEKETRTGRPKRWVNRVKFGG